ncbi:phospholipase-like protein [Tanacetum coccineum]
MLGRQMELSGDETDIVPLYYHIVDDFQIQFGREEFCLVTGLRFGVEYSDEYDNDEAPIPFRRWVFSSSLDGKNIIGQTVKDLIESQRFYRLHDDDAVSLCCVGILQLVLLGVDDRRRVPDGILRLANDRVAWDKYPWGSYVWPTLYSQLRDANVRRWPSLYGTEPRRGVDKKTYSIFGFTWAFKGGPAAFRTEPNNSFFEGVPSHGQNMGTPNWQTPMPSPPGTFNYQSQMPSHSATPYLQPPMHSGNPNLQTPISSHPDDAGFLNPRTPYMDLPPTTVLPKKRGDRTKNKVKNVNLSPLNLGNAFANDNVGDDDVMFLGGQFTGNYLEYDNVDPSKVIMEQPNQVGWLSGEHINSWIELLIRNRPQKALWTESKTGIKAIKNDYDTNVMYDIEKVDGKHQIFVSHSRIYLSMVLIPNDGSLEEAFASVIYEETKIKQQESLSSESEDHKKEQTQNDYTIDQMVEWAEQEHFKDEETK